mgnify:CR=1 FL=1
MSDIDILKEMFQDSIKIEMKDHYNQKQVKLQEDKAGYSVTISGLPDDTLVIKGDIEKLNHIFKDGASGDQKGQCRRADFIIFSNIGNKKFIICIELKKCSSTSSEEHIIQQFKGTLCFLGYCQQMGKEFWRKKDFLETFQYRFVSIRNINVPKKPTFQTPTNGLHDTPQKMLKISSPSCPTQFNKLVGK